MCKNRNDRQNLRPLSAIAIPTVAACACIYLYFYQNRVLHWLAVEDGPFEWLTALFYFFAALLFAFSMRGRHIGKLWLLGLALLCIFVAGEEVSWGQRVVGFDTPKLLEQSNLQSEFSLHNLKGIQEHVRALGLLVVFGLCLFMPVTDRFVPRLRNFYERLEFPVYPYNRVTWALLAVLFMVVPRFFRAGDFWLDEVGETFLSVGFLAYGLSQWSVAKEKAALHEN